MTLTELIPSFSDELAKIANIVEQAEKNLTSADRSPHGVQGRLFRLPLSKPKVSKTEGPRAYAPRI